VNAHVAAARWATHLLAMRKQLSMDVAMLNTTCERNPGEGSRNQAFLAHLQQRLRKLFHKIVRTICEAQKLCFRISHATHVLGQFGAPARQLFGAGATIVERGDIDDALGKIAQEGQARQKRTQGKVHAAWQKWAQDAFLNVAGLAHRTCK
ncbi:unnamed protein product, partial [Prorocentrum cordatum]